MKVKVTEEKLYPIFKKFMEIYFKNYKWRENEYGYIWFVDPDGYGHLELLKNKNLLIYRDIRVNILRYIPMELSILKSLMGKWVGETLQVESVNAFHLEIPSLFVGWRDPQVESVNTIQTIPVPNQFVGETFPL